ncbi:hypothetical protein EJ903_22625 [Azospirillum griseum]|uniref:Uncharacterized protein n=1 Tax=Azospirillum griseum TaxID=2496639 RepID=A0A431VBC4_9PROT|nr:hypothetical protein [Azospirillum griseum]RTR15684.1 hypothetical protein EJ903_22625 [Azospirillum griseum]
MLNPDSADHADASKGNVTLIPLNGKEAKKQFDTAWTYEIVAWLKKNSDSAAVSWWVGHDVTSGAAALAGPDAGGGRAALIHHMSYLAYQGAKHDDGAEAVAKDAEQKTLFRSPGAALFAVGPLLRDSCRRLAGDDREPVMLIPGFPDLPTLRPETDRLVAISFGRMEAASDRIKQGQLSVAAFGAAVKEAMGTSLCPPSMRDPRLYLIGLPEDNTQEAQAAFQLAEKHAGRTVNLLPLPFDRDRETLLGRLAEANLAFMLSWHEGFGLTGWEAIAAEVPLILSKKSGLFQLLQETLKGTEDGFVSAIDVEGRRGNRNAPNYTKADLRNVKNAILTASNNIGSFQNRAKQLKSRLQEKLVCRWDHTGRQFLEGLGIDGAPGPSSASPADNQSAAPDTEQPHSTKPNARSQTRSQSREERFAILKTAIRKALVCSSRVVDLLEGDFGSTASSSPTKPPTMSERARLLCDRLLEVHFTEAVRVLNQVRLLVDLEDPIDRTAVNAIAEVSAWLFPWLHIRDESIDCDRWEHKELGEIIALPSDIESFAEIIMAGIDIRMARFQPIRSVRDWPRSVVSLSFGTPEEAKLDEQIIGAADEDNIRKALALALNIPRNKRTGSNDIVDGSINDEIEYLFRENQRWYMICDHFKDADDQRYHMQLMDKIAKTYKGLAVINLHSGSYGQHIKFREIQKLLNLQGDQRP